MQLFVKYMHVSVQIWLQTCTRMFEFPPVQSIDVFDHNVCYTERVWLKSSISILNVMITYTSDSRMPPSYIIAFMKFNTFVQNALHYIEVFQNDSITMIYFYLRPLRFEMA